MLKVTQSILKDATIFWKSASHLFDLDQKLLFQIFTIKPVGDVVAVCQVQNWVFLANSFLEFPLLAHLMLWF